MRVLMDLDGNLLTFDQIKSMMETENGRKLIKEYCLSARIAYASQQMLNYLFEIDKRATEMKFDEMQELCQVAYTSLKHSHWKDIERFLVQACAESRKIFESREDYEKYMEC